LFFSSEKYSLQFFASAEFGPTGRRRPIHLALPVGRGRAESARRRNQCTMVVPESRKHDGEMHNLSNEKQRQLVASRGADDDAQYCRGSTPIALPGRARGNMRALARKQINCCKRARNIHVIKRQRAHALAHPDIHTQSKMHFPKQIPYLDWRGDASQILAGRTRT
jgi:hypothetical protein